MESLSFRQAQISDLDEVNTIIRECVMGWNIPDRVKRLSLGSYFYQLHDLEHLHIELALTPDNLIAGVAAWETANKSDLPTEKTGLLLHGLYIAPVFQHKGIGSELLQKALQAASYKKLNGLLVKAQADANGFFQSRKFTRLAVQNPETDYPHRWWKEV